MLTRLFAFRVLAILALAGCVASFLGDLLAAPAFCGAGPGCEEVSRSAFGRIAGVPLSLLGVLAFAVFFGISLFPAHRVGKCLGPLAILAGLLGLAFVLVQALLLGRFCRLCLVIDATAMMLAAVELASRSAARAALSPVGCLLWVGLALVAGGAPLAWSMLQPPPAVPAIVRAQWRSDRITVVEVTAFECLHCRRTHAPLSALLQEKGEQVHFVRLVKPLPGHVNGRWATRAYWFAAARGKAEPMADALFAAPDLGPGGCEKLVLALGLGLAEYRAFLADADTDRQIDEATAALQNVRALPTIWIDNRALVGGQTSQSLEAAYQRARQHRSQAPGW